MTFYPYGRPAGLTAGRGQAVSKQTMYAPGILPMSGYNSK